MAAQSIWKDKYISLGAASALFRLKDASGTVIYTGKAVAAPGTAAARVRVNDICADYMAAHSTPDFSDDYSDDYATEPSEGYLQGLTPGFVPQMLAESFSLEKQVSGGTWTAVESWTFLADWSYDYGYDIEAPDPLSFPIRRVVGGRQLLLFGVNDAADDLTATITYADRTTGTESVSIRRVPDYDPDGDYSYGVAALDLGSLEDTYGPVAKVVIEDYGWSWTVEDCHRYGLVYVNAYGGWDTFLPSRFELTSDKYTRHEVGVAYDNNDSEARGTMCYGVEISRGIRFHTPVLSDAEAARMHHLLGSSCVYLQDLTDGRFYPVLVDESSCDYKTFRNQGGNRVTYSFTVRLAHDMLRR